MRRSAAPCGRALAAKVWEWQTASCAAAAVLKSTELSHNPVPLMTSTLSSQCSSLRIGSTQAAAPISSAAVSPCQSASSQGMMQLTMEVSGIALRLPSAMQASLQPVVHHHLQPISSAFLHSSPQRSFHCRPSPTVVIGTFSQNTTGSCIESDSRCDLHFRSQFVSSNHLLI